MPLTEEERTYFRSKIGQTQATPTPGTLPPSIGQASGLPGLEVAGVTLGRSPSIRMAPPKVQQLTETERERTPMAQTSVAFLDQFAQQLGIDPAGKSLKHPEKIAPPLAREIVPQKFQDYVLSEESSILYNALESAFQLGAIVLTGRQGDVQKLQQIRDVYSFGGAVKDKPKLAAQRYQNLRRLFQTFDRVQTSTPDQQQTLLNQASQQMDSLLQGKPLTPELKPDEADIVKRLLSTP